jgi:hypothetical protein
MPKKRFTFQERIMQDIMLLTVDENFLIDIKNLRNKHGYPMNLEEHKIDDYLESPECANFSKDERLLVEKYFIPESHVFAFSNYVQSGNFDHGDPQLHKLLYLNPQCQITSEKEEDSLIIKIYPDTTLDDIRDNWPRIKFCKDKILNRKLERKVRIENLERDLEILQLKRAGKIGMEIRDIINKNDRFKGQEINYEEVPKLIARLKKMAEKYKFQERIKPKKMGGASKKS